MAPTTSRGLQHEKPIGKDDPYGLAEGREGPLSQSEQSKKKQWKSSAMDQRYKENKILQILKFAETPFHSAC